jgi:uncharacterized protein YuzE
MKVRYFVDMDTLLIEFRQAPGAETRVQCGETKLAQRRRQNSAR